MIAYVFWHWKQPSIAAPEYEKVQRTFHDALAASPPKGYHWSQSFALSRCAWAADGGDAYEDRYLVDDFAALDLLDAAAVEHAHLDDRAGHARRHAQGGVAHVGRLFAEDGA